MKHIRQISSEFEKLLHVIKGIIALEAKEARLRTQKRKLFLEHKEIIDRMALREGETRRKDDYPYQERM